MENLLADPFIEFALILVIGTILGLIGHFFKQPLIVTFIAAGILIGPSGFKILSSHDQVALLADIGIAVLLFVVGLKLDLSEIKNLGKVSLYTGLGQVVFTSLVGLVLALLLKYDFFSAIYIAIALTFSSTIIIVKLLSDKKEVDSLHGRIAIGFLIVQDIVAISIMIGLSALGLQASSHQDNVTAWLKLITEGLILVILIPLIGWKSFPNLLKKIARNPELLVFFAIAWAVLISSLSSYIGIGKEMGAFIAGVALANSGLKELIDFKMTTLRDFLLFFFFIHLGSNLDLSLIQANILDSLVFSLFVLIGNPLIVLIIMGALGYTKRTGFLSGLTVAQISEFSLIFAAMGLALGHINEKTMGMITFIGLITIGISTYMILYSAFLYEKLAPFLGLFERKKNKQKQASEAFEQIKNLDAILIGVGRYGRHLLNALGQQGYRVLAVDFDPEIIAELKEQGHLALYGDIEDPDLIDFLPLANTKSLISTTVLLRSNLALITYLKNAKFKGKIIITAHYESHIKKIYEQGADLVVSPYLDAVENFCEKFNKL